VVKVRTVFVSALVASFIAVGTGIGAPAALASGSGGGGGSVPSAPASSRPDSPEQQAEVDYQKGLKHKDKAWQAEEKAKAATSDRRRARDEKRAAKEYKKAQERFTKVLQAFPEHYKAANELGYVLRKQGEYKSAIGAYTLALRIYPEFLQAIEYRAEAYVAIGLYDEAREAYMQLFSENTELADELMASMQAWASKQDSPDVRARNFIEWVESRQKVSAFGELTESNSSGW